MGKVRFLQLKTTLWCWCGHVIPLTQLFIPLLSETQIKSKYCQDELALAYVSSKPIFPVALQTPEELFPQMDTGLWVQQILSVPEGILCEMLLLMICCVTFVESSSHKNVNTLIVLIVTTAKLSVLLKTSHSTSFCWVQGSSHEKWYKAYTFYVMHRTHTMWCLALIQFLCSGNWLELAGRAHLQCRTLDPWKLHLYIQDLLPLKLPSCLKKNENGHKVTAGGKVSPGNLASSAKTVMLTVAHFLVAVWYQD